jgi:hypothetical protein
MKRLPYSSVDGQQALFGALGTSRLDSPRRLFSHMRLGNKQLKLETLIMI